MHKTNCVSAFLVKYLTVLAWLVLLTGCSPSEQRQGLPTLTPRIQSPPLATPSATATSAEPQDSPNPFPIHLTNSLEGISPNGEWIAMAGWPATADGESQFATGVLLNQRTQNQRWVPLYTSDKKFGRAITVDFSPDNRLLVLANLKGTLLVYRLSDLQEYRVIHYQPWMNYQSVPWIRYNWISDSKSFLVYMADPTNFIYVVDLDGNSRPLLTVKDIYFDKTPRVHDTDVDFMPVYSPDGTQIAYLADFSGYGQGSINRPVDNQLWMIDVATGKREMVYQGLTGERPTWSPDSQKVLFK